MVTERIDVSMVHGIGFDATCSLVALDKNFMPVSVSPMGRLQLKQLYFIELSICYIIFSLMQL